VDCTADNEMSPIPTLVSGLLRKRASPQLHFMVTGDVHHLSCAQTNNYAVWSTVCEKTLIKEISFRDDPFMTCFNADDDMEWLQNK